MLNIAEQNINSTIQALYENRGILYSMLPRPTKALRIGIIPIATRAGATL